MCVQCLFSDAYMCVKCLFSDAFHNMVPIVRLLAQQATSEVGSPEWWQYKGLSSAEVAVRLWEEMPHKKSTWMSKETNTSLLNSMKLPADAKKLKSFSARKGNMLLDLQMLDEKLEKRTPTGA